MSCPHLVIPSWFYFVFFHHNLCIHVCSGHQRPRHDLPVEPPEAKLQVQHNSWAFWSTFIYMISLDLGHSPAKHLGLVLTSSSSLSPPFYRWEHWGSEWVSNLEPRLQLSSVWLQSLWFTPEPLCLQSLWFTPKPLCFSKTELWFLNELFIHLFDSVCSLKDQGDG